MKKIDEMAIGGMNTIGSGAIDAAGPGDIPPGETELGRKRRKMRDCAKRHKKKHVKESVLGTAMGALSALVGSLSGGRRSGGNKKRPTSVPSAGKKAERVMKSARKAADEKRPVNWRGGDSHGNAYKQRLNQKPSSRDGSSEDEKKNYVKARLDPKSQVSRDKIRNRETMRRVQGNQMAIVGNDLENNQSRIVGHTANFSPSNAKGSDVDGTENSGVIITKIDGKPRRSYLRTKPGKQ